LFRSKIQFALFREPDLGGQATALATEPLSGDRRAAMQRFRCLRDSELIGN
jgi:hypothetical protein